jgi:predicted nucleic acid-binding protein
MQLVDSSAWIEFPTDSALGTALASELPDRRQWLVPTMVQLELAKWLTRELGEDKADRSIAFTETCVVADLDTAIALSAADLCARHRLATAAAIVYATALAHGAGLLTCDRHFEKLPSVVLSLGPAYEPIIASSAATRQSPWQCLTGWGLLRSARNDRKTATGARQ